MFADQKNLSITIVKRKAERPYMRINKIVGDCYYLIGQDNTEHTLHIDFDRMDPLPQVGDGLYLSENMVNGIKENLFSYTFSTHIGETYARKPHDFLKESKEFLIFEYENGRTVLLEQWYG